MQPNQQLQLDYALEIQSKPFALNRNLVDNGVYFHQGAFEPILGYANMLEIEDNYTRKQYGLQPKQASAPQSSLIARKRQMEATLSTLASQTAFTSGELVDQWHQQDRAYFNYRMDAKVYPIVGYFSANYQVYQTEVAGIPVQLYYHPAHARNIPEIAKATATTLNYMQQHYGAYPYQSLRLIEVPKYHPFGGRASAGVVALNERLFLQDYQDGAAINNVARNTIHEVAHQWFGEKLVPKIVVGEDVLTESVSKAIEADVLGLMYGATMRQSLMAYNLRRYQHGRAFAYEAEPALLKAEQQAYLTYGKGPLVFDAVKQHLGSDRYHAVLRQFIEQHQTEMKATLPQLVNLFAAQSDNPQWVRQLFSEPGLQALELLQQK